MEIHRICIQIVLLPSPNFAHKQYGWPWVSLVSDSSFEQIEMFQGKVIVCIVLGRRQVSSRKCFRPSSLFWWMRLKIITASPCALTEADIHRLEHQKIHPRCRVFWVEEGTAQLVFLECSPHHFDEVIMEMVWSNKHIASGAESDSDGILFGGWWATQVHREKKLEPIRELLQMERSFSNRVKSTSIDFFCEKLNLRHLLQVWVSVRSYSTSLPPKMHHQISIHFQTRLSPEWLYFQNKLSPSNLRGQSSHIHTGFIAQRPLKREIRVEGFRQRAELSMVKLIQSLGVPGVVDGSIRDFNEKETAVQGYILVKKWTLYDDQKNVIALRVKFYF